jgi:alpha-galactosidase/6-phospho-beta-glucosidase family protein
MNHEDDTVSAVDSAILNKKLISICTKFVVFAENCALHMHIKTKKVEEVIVIGFNHYFFGIDPSKKSTTKYKNLWWENF